MQITTFDPATPVFGQSSLRPGDVFKPSSDAKVAIKIPFLNKSVVSPWPMVAQFDRIDPHTMVWHEWLPKPTGMLRQFSADVTLQQNGGELELSMNSRMNGIPLHAKRSYRILSSDAHSLKLEDPTTGQQCITEFTPTNSADPTAPKFDVFFDWTIPMGMHITKHGELYQQPANAEHA